MDRARMLRGLALEAHRKGDAEAALKNYAQAEDLLGILAGSSSRYSEEARILLLASQRDRRAAEGPKGAAATLLDYLNNPYDADWDLFLDFDRISARLVGEEEWRQLREPFQILFVQFLKEGGLRLFGEQLNQVGGVEYRFSEPEYDGDEAKVEVTNRIAGIELDILMRFKSHGTIWRFYDGDVYALQASFTQYLGKAIELARQGRSLEEYLGTPGIQEELREHWFTAARQIGDAYQDTFQGMVVRVIAEEGATVSSGANILGVVPEGTLFKVVQERKTTTGSWLLGNFLIQGMETHGWVPKMTVKPVEERN